MPAKDAGGPATKASARQTGGRFVHLVLVLAFVSGFGCHLRRLTLVGRRLLPHPPALTGVMRRTRAPGARKAAPLTRPKRGAACTPERRGRPRCILVFTCPTAWHSSLCNALATLSIFRLLTAPPTTSHPYTSSSCFCLASSAARLAAASFCARAAVFPTAVSVREKWWAPSCNYRAAQAHTSARSRAALASSAAFFTAAAASSSSFLFCSSAVPEGGIKTTPADAGKGGSGQGAGGREGRWEGAGRHLERVVRALA